MNDEPNQIQIQAKQVSLPAIEESASYLCDQITSLNKNDIISRTNCKFCQHPARAEAEAIWEQKKNVTAVIRFFNETYPQEHPGDAEIPMNFGNVKAHIYNHYEHQERSIYIREYSENVKKMVNYKLSKNRMLDEMAAMAGMKMYEIAADPRLCPLKATDSLTKLWKAMLDIMEIQAKLTGEISTADVVVQKFQNAFLYIIKNEADDHVKRRLVEAFDIFQEKVEEGSGGE